MFSTATTARLKTLRLVLASQSPRRRELLERCGIEFEALPSAFEEDLDKGAFSTPDLYVMETALQKALDVARRLGAEGGEGRPALVIGSDTVVALGEAVLEKPRDEDDARRMLAALSGRDQEVHTGVALVFVPRPGAAADAAALPRRVFSETTAVKFGDLPAEAIDAYVATGEPMDKAGAYGIQGRAAAFVEGIRGCYYNVMGFPVHRFCRELNEVLAPGAEWGERQ